MEGPLQILKEESLKVKELIGNIKIKPTKNQDKNPLPIHIHINISQPDDALAYDINEIKLEIIITQLEPAQLLVKVDPQLNGLPIELSTAMEKMIQKQWDYSLMKKNNQEFISWMFPEIMKWVKLRFVKIISCVPDCLESYLGTSAAGESMRRYAVIIKNENNIIAPDEEELEFDEDEAAEYWRKKREQEYEALLVQQKKEAEEKRLEYERDPSLHYKVPILSRKEQEALKAERDKQGVRLRKTGPRRKKFDPTAAAEREKK